MASKLPTEASVATPIPSRARFILGTDSHFHFLFVGDSDDEEEEDGGAVVADAVFAVAVFAVVVAVVKAVDDDDDVIAIGATIRSDK